VLAATGQALYQECPLKPLASVVELQVPHCTAFWWPWA
jgi:hypothetical protein